MKRILLCAGAVLALSACQKSPEFQLVSSELPTEFNGKYIYIEDENFKTLDSVLVENQAIAYTAAVDTIHPRYLVIGENKFLFVQEPATITLKKTETPNGYAIEGSRLVDIYNTFEPQLEEIYGPAKQKLRDLSADTAMSNEEKAKLRDQYLNDANAKLKEVTTKHYTDNKENALAPLAFISIPTQTEEEYLAMYEAAPKHVQEVKEIKDRYDALKAAQKYQAGNDYADFTFKDAQGEEHKLSDYRKEGGYLLIDFWASWCGPCRMAMPHLAELNKKYAAKGLTVLSLGTWDKPAENAKSVEALGITWAAPLDTESVGAKTYGVLAIPTMILIAPDGKILVRTHNPDEVTDKIQEVLK